MKRTNKTGRSEGLEHFARMTRTMMETPAWRDLSPIAQALYVWLKLEWRGPNANNNGAIRLSIRQAADKLGVGTDAANRAFHDLQAKGFLVVIAPARLGCTGAAKSPDYELTEIPLPRSEKPEGRKLYRHWVRGQDFPVTKSMANNPSGRNGQKQNPVTIIGTACHEKRDELKNTVIKIVTGYSKNHDGFG